MDGGGGGNHGNLSSSAKGGGFWEMNGKGASRGTKGQVVLSLSFCGFLARFGETGKGRKKVGMLSLKITKGWGIGGGERGARAIVGVRKGVKPLRAS